MRRIVITQNITVDGVIDMSTGWFDPADPESDQSDLVAVDREHRSRADVLLVGRGTYESFRDFWPTVEGDTTGVADYLERVDKHVVSSTLPDDPGWSGTTVVRGSVTEHATRLKAQPGGDVVVTGSPGVAQELLTAGLVDELRLFVFPVVVGAGARLMPDGLQLRLQQLKSRSFRLGTTMLRYQVLAQLRPEPSGTTS